VTISQPVYPITAPNLVTHIGAYADSVSAAVQTNLAAHAGSTTAHAATSITATPSGSLNTSTVQAQLYELRDEKPTTTDWTSSGIIDESTLAGLETANTHDPKRLYLVPTTAGTGVLYFLYDDFDRDITDGVGGPTTPASTSYTTAGGVIANYDVVKTGAAGGDSYMAMQVTSVNGSRAVWESGSLAVDQNILARFALQTTLTADQAWFCPLARIQGTTDINNCYRLRVAILSTGVVQITPQKVVAGTAAGIGAQGAVTVTGLTYTAGTKLNARLRLSGTTSTLIQCTLWADTTTEPSTPTVSVTDTSTPITTSGGAGVYVFSGGSIAPTTVDWRVFHFSGV
jgi:hypothetical protein